ncbi:hypothetical protein Tco_0755019 [Tanacetum coccineum]
MYKHVGLKGTSTQEGKRSQDDEDKRLCLVDDLKEVQVHIQVKLKGTSLSLKPKDHYAYHKLKDKDSRLRAKTMTFIEYKIDNLIIEKDKIQDECFQLKNAIVRIQHETELSENAFKAREIKYLKDIVDLEEKLSSHDRIVYKRGQSIQTIHMFGKKSNKVYDPFLKARVGYQNLERLKKAIAAQPKMYDGERLQSTKLIIDLPDYEETLEDVEESRLKMKDKMIL